MVLNHQHLYVKDYVSSQNGTKNFICKYILKEEERKMRDFNSLKIAVAGTGYVGLSIATLLSQHHQVTAVDIIPEKVELINNKKSPIQDDYIEKYLEEKELNLTATLNAKDAYEEADFVVYCSPNKL